MTLELFLRYLHFISIFVIVGTLVSEFVFVKPTLKREDIKYLSQIDGVYGLAALSLVTAGLTLWLGGFGKPSEFYSYNWIFLTKLGCFSAIGILSIYPTVFFLRQRKGNPTEVVTVPNAIFWCIRLELILLVIIPLLAGLMSRGVGYFGTA